MSSDALLFPSPEEYEQHVKGLLDRLGAPLDSYQSTHREVIRAPDGEYEIDITVRFNALGVRFLVLVECKCWTRPVKRDHVQMLQTKKESIGAQGAMLFTTSAFQSGAVEFANIHGIALLHVKPGTHEFHRVSESCRHPVPPLSITNPTWLLKADVAEGTLINYEKSWFIEHLQRRSPVEP